MIFEILKYSFVATKRILLLIVISHRLNLLLRIRIDIVFNLIRSK